MPRILILEPDIMLAQTYVQACERAGYQTALAASAQQAIHLADERTPDVVLLEMQLPAHSGLEFLYEFRSYPEWQTVPVIINSYIPPQEFAAWQETLSNSLGVRALLYKPRTSLPLLLRTLTEHMPAQSN